MKKITEKSIETNNAGNWSNFSVSPKNKCHNWIQTDGPYEHFRLICVTSETNTLIDALFVNVNKDFVNEFINYLQNILEKMSLRKISPYPTLYVSVSENYVHFNLTNRVKQKLSFPEAKFLNQIEELEKEVEQLKTLNLSLKEELAKKEITEKVYEELRVNMDQHKNLNLSLNKELELIKKLLSEKESELKRKTTLWKKNLMTLTVNYEDSEKNLLDCSQQLKELKEAYQKEKDTNKSIWSNQHKKTKKVTPFHVDKETMDKRVSINQPQRPSDEACIYSVPDEYNWNLIIDIVDQQVKMRVDQTITSSLLNQFHDLKKQNEQFANQLVLCNETINELKQENKTLEGKNALLQQKLATILETVMVDLDKPVC